MKEIPKKNYVILLLLICITVFFVLNLSNFYKNRNLEESEIYTYSNKITYKEFDVYITENPDSIIYISNKNNKDNELFEKKLIDKIEKIGLKDYFVFINANSKIINKINKKYKQKININNLPVVISFIDNKIVNYSYITNESDVDVVISYGDYE